MPRRIPRPTVRLSALRCHDLNTLLSGSCRSPPVRNCWGGIKMTYSLFESCVRCPQQAGSGTELHALVFLHALLSELRLLKIALGVIICTLAQLADSSGPHFAQSGSETAVMTTPYRQPAPPNTGASQHRRSGAPAVVRLTKPFL